MFSEYTMLKPGPVKEYIGFTEEEVARLCEGSKFTAKDIKDWYDGYNLDGLEIYNSNSVVSALREGVLTSYWTDTDAFEDLLSYIKMNVDGLHDVILKPLANERYVLSSSESFKNDLVNLESKNDYLVALVHLGYLSYNFGDGTLKIPNNEIRIQFVDSIGMVEPSVLARYYTYSNGLLDATLSLDAVAAAEMLGRMFSEFTIKTGYSYEDSFDDFIFSAYMSANDYYDVIHEAPRDG
ncbi:MAG: hypothetical protein LUD29_06000 [Clostridia bacterium]|nr:hypothetical protein [Clostridia bacterium]